jgi:2-polyprenyl-3-methyl-5-hydroxy-6-metoxy-1,4-benzoquinol methylase
MQQTFGTRDRTTSGGELHVGDRVAAQQRSYFGAYRRTGDDPKYRKIRTCLLSLAPAKILDVGCTNGALLEPFVRRGWSCSGFELCAEPAAEARRKGIDVTEGDASLGLPYPDDTFDVVVAGEILEHMIDDVAFLRELRRVVRLHGLVMLTTPNLVSLGNRLLMSLGRMPRFAYADFHYSIYNRYVLLEKLRVAGLSIEKVQGSYVGISRTFSPIIGAFGEYLGAHLPTLGEHFVVFARKSSDGAQ